jgi:hypothetical protein
MDLLVSFVSGTSGDSPVGTAANRRVARSAECQRGGRVTGWLSADQRFQEATMSTQAETGDVTGTKDKDYNIIWFTEACLDNALRLETYVQDAERDGDEDLATFFRKAQADSRKGAEQGKQMLKARL